MELTKFFSDFCVNKSDFCKKADISYTTMMKIVNKGHLPTKRIAEKIKRASNGVVCMHFKQKNSSY